MANSIWKGNVSFGLIQIPVSLSTAEARREQIRFQVLDERDLSPVRNVRINETTGEEVPYKETVRGFEYEKDHYVVLSPAEINEAGVESFHRLVIEDFVSIDEIPPSFMKKPYYVDPDANGEASYALLREVLERSGKAAIGRLVMRSRQHLVAIIPQSGGLLLEILRFAHEIREPHWATPMDPRHHGLSEREIQTALELVEWMSSDWQPEKYPDTFHDELKRIIDRKVRSGNTYVSEEMREPEVLEPTAPDDLMAMLERSVERAERDLQAKPHTRGKNDEAGTRRAPAR